jgi:elongation factor Tu
VAVEPRGNRSERIPSLTVVTLGHHRTGKTTLLAALLRAARGLPGASKAWSRVLTVRELNRLSGSPPLSELDSEKWPTVEVVHERFRLPSRRIVVADAPGRRSWMRGVSRGISAADAALLVVSGPESVEAQTIEHLQLAQALGCSRVLAFINKCDRVRDPEWLDLVESELREAAEACGLDGDAMTVIRGAAQPALEGDVSWSGGIRELIAALEYGIALPRLDASGPPHLYVDRASPWEYGGQRLLVMGRLRRGTLTVGQPVRLAGVGLATEATVESMEIFGRRVERAAAGAQLGVMLVGEDPRVRASALRRGQSILGEGLASPASQLVVEIEAFPPARGGRTRPLVGGLEVCCLFGAVILSGWLRFEGAPRVEPGGRGRVRIHLRSAAYFEPGMTFALGCGHQPGGGSTSRSALRYGLVGRGRILAVD